MALTRPDRKDALLDVPDLHVLAVERQPERLLLTVETDADVAGSTVGVPEAPCSASPSPPLV